MRKICHKRRAGPFPFPELLPPEKLKICQTRQNDCPFIFQNIRKENCENLAHHQLHNNLVNYSRKRNSSCLDTISIINDNRSDSGNETFPLIKQSVFDISNVYTKTRCTTLSSITTNCSKSLISQSSLFCSCGTVNSADNHTYSVNHRKRNYTCNSEESITSKVKRFSNTFEPERMTRKSNGDVCGDGSQSQV